MNPYGEFTSPFIEGTKLQFAWDSTSLGLLKECPRKYQYTMIEGWRSKSESVHFTFGILFHKSLERFDLFRAEGLSPEDAVDKVLDLLLQDTWERPAEGEGQPWSPDHSKKNRATLVRSVLWYLDAYKDDPAQTVILANGKPAVELSFRFDTGIEARPGTNYILSGHMDRVVQFGDDKFVMDRKTTGSTIGSYYFDQYSPDNQMTLYTLAGRVVYDMPVAGVMIDAAQIAVGFTAFSRGITTRSDGQLDEWLNDLTIWFKTAEFYASQEHWPMNEKSCGAYGGCVFRGVCNKDPRVRDKFLETDFHRVYWNPLQER